MSTGEVSVFFIFLREVFRERLHEDWATMNKIAMIGYSINEYTRTFSDYGNRMGA